MWRMGFGGDATARRRRSSEEVLAQAKEIVRRHEEGQPTRAIARALGLSRGSVRNVIDTWEDALTAEEADEEAAAVLARLGSAPDPDFALEDADPVLVGELRAAGVDLEHEETLHALARVHADPDDQLARYQLRHAPKTAEWWEGRNNLGQLIVERAKTDAMIDAGWRYHSFCWHDPAGSRTDPAGVPYGDNFRLIAFDF
jgi:hypothetical protein